VLRQCDGQADEIVINGVCGAGEQVGHRRTCSMISAP
jgi:hypothetical protein